MSVVSIPAHRPFLETLARGLIDRPDFLEGTVLLPTHRACRAFTEVLLGIGGGRARILPRILSLGELDPDTIIIQAEAEAELADELELRPAIAPLRRQLLLARLIMRMDPEVPPDRALKLSAALARLIDEVQFNGLDFAKLDGLAPDHFSEHWGITLRFLGIVTENWPEILRRDEDRLDPIDRRNRLIEAQIGLWRRNTPKGLLVAAGSTGIMPATGDMLAFLSRQPYGLVVLPGLDRHLDDESWTSLSPSHPQWALSALLKRIERTRDEVPDWPETGTRPTARVRLVAETMRPAETTERWRDLPAGIGEGTEGLSVATFPGPVAEAGGVALMLRQAAEEGRTAALVTPNRELARRVSTELARWGIVVDDSAGVPLDRTPPGTFMRLAAHAFAEDFAPAPLLALLKHPLAACRRAPGRFREDVREMERRLLRGPRPGRGLEGILDAAERKGAERQQDERLTPEQKEAAERRYTGFGRTIGRVARALEPLNALSGAGRVSIADLLRAHVLSCEQLARTGDAQGRERLWKGEAGEALARLISELDAATHGMPAIEPEQYPALFDTLLGGEAVRLRRPNHPGLSILGPLEARLQRADRLVLAGLNQGDWPAEPPPDPWMSRGMRAEFGLPAQETRAGLAAHDFAQALCAPEVVLTRSERAGGNPTVPSRWLQRLETVLKVAGRTVGDPRWAAWQVELDAAKKVRPIKPPQPRPPVAARPRRLSATRVEAWLRDPYGIFARHVLALRPLEPIDADPGARERGEAIHRALEDFVRAHPSGELPEDAFERLIGLGEESFGPLLERPLARTFWTRRFRRAAEFVLGIDRERRSLIRRILIETEGRILLDGPEGDFALTAVADRIEVRDGGTVIVDYKSGQTPTRKSAVEGPVRQLPIEAIIAEAGGFDGCPAVPVEALEYWPTGGSRSTTSPTTLGTNERSTADIISDTREGLRRYIAAFDDPDMPYLAEPRPEFKGGFNDYRHLSRIAEWSRGL